MGSQVIAAWIAQGAFLMLIAFAAFERGARIVALFVGLWIAGYIGSEWLPYGGFFSSYVAVLDIALVFLVFQGDVRLS